MYLCVMMFCCEITQIFFQIQNHKKELIFLNKFLKNTHARVKLYQVLLYTFSALYIQIYMQFLFREKKIYKNKHQISQNPSPPVAFFCKRKKKYFFKEKNKQNKNLFVFIVDVVKTNIYFSFFFSSKCDVFNFENLF